MSLSQTHFQNAHHFEVNHGQFNNIANATIVNVADTDAVSSTLCQYVATGAMFDSAERYPPGKCHPGTRKRIIKEIMDWIDDPHTIQCIVWLYGPAGSGKSALAQSICELLAGSRPERRGASFFFATGLTDRGNAFKLFTTISYQLAVHFPSVRSEINKALTHDPTLPTKSMEIQLQSLIVEPLLQCENFPSHHPIIIIDGLDECADDEEANTQREIIALIASSIVDYKLPLLFFVASRPEYWIRDAFSTSPLPTITLPFSLRQSFDTDQDIRTYLTAEFERICAEKKRVMGSVELPWPPTHVVNRLVYEASGQFIYASTVIRFVGKSSRFSKPQEQLYIITSPGPNRALAFSELDRLYARILSAYPQWETMKRVLGGLLVYPNTTIVRVFLAVDSDDIVLVMDALSSLVDTNDARTTDKMLDGLLKFTSSKVMGQETVSFCHLSFVEFLEDQTRSGKFHIDVDGFRDEISRALFGMIHSSLDESYQSDRYSNWNIDFATYRWIMYKVTIESLRDSRTDTLRPLVTYMSERILHLAEFSFGGSVESLVRFEEDMRVLECALEADLGASGRWEKGEDLNQLTDFRLLCENFRDAVSLAQRRAMHALTLCTELKLVTPLLVYMAEFYMGTEWISPEVLSTMIGSTDVAATIEQNRHIMRLSYFHSSSQWRLKLADRNTWFGNGHATNSHIQESTEWKHQRLFLAQHLLKLVFNQTSSFRVDSRDYECCSILKERFFDTMSITDICGRTNLQNACKCLSLLTFIGDLHLERIVNFRPGGKVPGFITSMICWLNRHLTRPEYLKNLQDHQKTLPQKMTATIKYLFEKYFLQDFTNYARKNKQLYDDEPAAPWATLTVLPLPEGYHLNSTSDYPEIRVLDWQTFHDEVFGEHGNLGSSTSPIIDPACWFPRLTSHLLWVLVEFLYYQAHPRYTISNSWNEGRRVKFQKSLSYIQHCLPFTHPNSENLDAFRLIVYLYPQVRCSASELSLLPEGIWLSIAAALQKYPRSLLSSEELGLFESWLYSSNHAYIGKYVGRGPVKKVLEEA